MALTPTSPAGLAASRIKTLLEAIGGFNTWIGSGEIHLESMAGAPDQWPWVQIYTSDAAVAEEQVAVETYSRTDQLSVAVGGLVSETHGNTDSDAGIYIQNELEQFKGWLESIRGNAVDGVRLDFRIRDGDRPAFTRRSEVVDDGSENDRYDAYQFGLVLELGPSA